MALKLERNKIFLSEPSNIDDCIDEGISVLSGCLAACFVYSACAVETVNAQSWQPLTTSAARRKANAPPQVRLAPSAAAAAAATPFPLANTFKLHSRPQAALKIYLDFDGHVTQNTPWNFIGAAPGM